MRTFQGLQLSISCMYIFAMDSSALETQIREFVKDVQEELSKPGFNSFGLGDCKVPKVLGDFVESIAGAVFLDSGYDTSVVWKVFQPLLDPMVTPKTLPIHLVRELQECCQQQAEGLEYKVNNCPLSLFK